MFSSSNHTAAKCKTPCSGEVFKMDYDCKGFCLFDNGDQDEHNGVVVVEICEIFVTSNHLTEFSIQDMIAAHDFVIINYCMIL